MPALVGGAALWGEPTESGFAGRLRLTEPPGAAASSHRPEPTALRTPAAPSRPSRRRRQPAGGPGPVTGGAGHGLPVYAQGRGDRQPHAAGAGARWGRSMHPALLLLLAVRGMTPCSTLPLSFCPAGVPASLLLDRGRPGGGGGAAQPHAAGPAPPGHRRGAEAGGGPCHGGGRGQGRRAAVGRAACGPASRRARCTPNRAPPRLPTSGASPPPPPLTRRSPLPPPSCSCASPSWWSFCRASWRRWRACPTPTPPRSACDASPCSAWRPACASSTGCAWPVSGGGAGCFGALPGSSRQAQPAPQVLLHFSGPRVPSPPTLTTACHSLHPYSADRDEDALTHSFVNAQTALELCGLTHFEMVCACVPAQPAVQAAARPGQGGQQTPHTSAPAPLQVWDDTTDTHAALGWSGTDCVVAFRCGARHRL